MRNRQTAILRDFCCADATNLLAEIHRKHQVGRATLRRCKALLSAIFKYAKQEGLFDGENPARDAGVPRKAKKSNRTHAYSPQEIRGLLTVLDGVAKVAVAIMYSYGLRPGEARGLGWGDCDGTQLSIRRSLRQTHVGEPKTEQSVGSVLVPATLGAILEEYRQTSLHRRNRDYIPTGSTGKLIDLHNLASRVVKPALARARKEGKISFAWRCWSPCRRGIATLATQVESPLAAKGLLRHKNVATTEAFYIKDVPEETQRAVDKIDSLFQQQKGSIQ